MRGFHHYYLGCAVLLGDFYLIWSRWSPTWLNWGLFWLAWIIITDDFYQHMRQQKKPEYLSPLHRMYGLLYRHRGFIRWLNRLADKIFGA